MKTIFAQVSGQVLDLAGKPVANAGVRLTGPSTLNSVSDSGGRFVFANVAPGTYALAVAASGYETVVRANVVVANEDLALDVRLAAVTALKEIGHVTTSAGRSTINVTAAPSYTLTPADMAFQGQTQWRKILEELPGVSVTDNNGYGGSLIPGSPINGAVVSIRGALPYESAMLIDNMPMYSASLTTGQGGNAVDLAPYNPQAFAAFDVVAGPGGQSPSIVNSIGGSLNLHPAGQVTRDQYDFSLNSDPYGGWMANSTIALHLHKLSMTATYGLNNSPGPFLGTQQLVISDSTGVSSVNGVPFVCNSGCGLAPIYPSGATAFTYSRVSNGFVACCIPYASSGWVNHSGSLSLFYQLSPSAIAQFFYAGNNGTAQEGGGILPTLFTPSPASGYAGALPAGTVLMTPETGAFASTPTSEQSAIFEGKLIFDLRRGQLQIAALSNHTETSSIGTNATSLGILQVFGGGSECPLPTCTSTAQLTPVAFNGTMNSVTFFPFSQINQLHSHNRDMSASYAAPIGDRGRGTISLVHSYYDTSIYTNISEQINNGLGGPFPFTSIQLPESNFVSTDEVRLGYGLNPSDRTSLDLSYYFTGARFHVVNPSSATAAQATLAAVTYLDQHFHYDSPRLSFVWRPYHDLAIRAATGGGFAIPSLTDMVGTNAAVSCVGGLVCQQNLQNINLQPETSWGFDLGFDERIAHDTIISFDVYQTDLKGQFYKDVSLDGTIANGTSGCATVGGCPLMATQFGNLGKTRYQGLALEAHRDIPRGIVWNLSGALMRGYLVAVPAGFYNRGTNTCNFAAYSAANCTNTLVVPNINFNGLFTLANVPYAQGFAQVGYRWSPDRFVNLDMHYFGSNNGYYVPAFVVLDANAQIPLTKNVSLQGTFRNITGMYDNVTSNIGQGYIYPTVVGPSAYGVSTPYGPRTFLVTLHVHS